MRLIKFANVLIVNPSGDVLVLRRSATHPTKAFEFDFPGGGLDGDETFEQAAIREVREETGLTIELADLELVRQNIHDFAEHRLHGVMFKAILPIHDPIITLSYEHDEYHWTSSKNMPSLPHFHQQSVEHALTKGML